MKNYALYYSYKGIGDVVIVMFEDKKATRYVKKGRVTVIYHDDEVIGYNIFDIKEILKIKSEGMIYLPSPALVEVLNTILINEGVEPLKIMENSGYFTAKVQQINGNYARLSLGDKEINASVKDDIRVNDNVVIAIKGTHLYNGKVVEDEALVCTYKQLGISIEDDRILHLDEDVEIGKDFFSSEVKIYD